MDEVRRTSLLPGGRQSAWVPSRLAGSREASVKDLRRLDCADCAGADRRMIPLCYSMYIQDACLVGWLVVPRLSGDKEGLATESRSMSDPLMAPCLSRALCRRVGTNLEPMSQCDLILPTYAVQYLLTHNNVA